MTQQDQFIIYTAQRGEADRTVVLDTPAGVFALLVDGLGNGPGAAFATQTATKFISDQMLRPQPEADAATLLTDAVLYAHKAIAGHVERHPEMDGMGCTVAAVLITEDAAYSVHVGDSRIYQLRGRSVVYRSIDHSKAQALARAGAMTDAEARTAPEANIVTRAVGVSRGLKPRIITLPYLKGDRFVLASDSVWSAIPQQDLVQNLSPKTLTQTTADTALDLAPQTLSGAVSIIQTTQNSILKTPMPRSARLIIVALSILCAASIALNIVQAVSTPSAPAPKAVATPAAPKAKPAPRAVAAPKAVKAQPKAPVAHKDTVAKPAAPVVSAEDAVAAIQAINNAAEGDARTELRTAAIAKLQQLEKGTENPNLRKAIQKSISDLQSDRTLHPEHGAGQVNTVARQLRSAAKAEAKATESN